MKAVNKMPQVRIPASLDARLEELAQQTGRSKGYHTRKALESYLEDMEDRELVRAAIAEGRGKETTSLEDIVKEFGFEEAVYGRPKAS